MQYLGKIVGVLLGYWSGTGIWGVLIGCFLGHLYDRKFAQRRLFFFSDHTTRQTFYFQTTFQIMGHLSKAKGRVTIEDIQVAELFMDRLGMNQSARSAAQQAFREGKAADYPLRQKLRELRLVCIGRTDLLNMFLEIQMQMALADGVLDQIERQILYIIAEELGTSRVQFEHYLRSVGAGWEFYDGQKKQQQQNYQEPANRKTPLDEACQVLGVNASDDTTTIKKAYRRLMSEYHPDKMVAKGLPPELMQVAKEKAQRIQAAYDFIKREKGFK